jgi:hypothetical protein
VDFATTLNEFDLLAIALAKYCNNGYSPVQSRAATCGTASQACRRPPRASAAWWPSSRRCHGRAEDAADLAPAPAPALEEDDDGGECNMFKYGA